MTKKIAVVADAMSDDFVFPSWRKYYEEQVGCRNIFLFTYKGLSEQFKKFNFGSVIELPVGYEDTLRKTVINRFVATMLSCYDTVIRVDADEFLVVDPREASCLADFINRSRDPFDGPRLRRHSASRRAEPFALIGRAATGTSAVCLPELGTQ